MCPGAALSKVSSLKRVKKRQQAEPSFLCFIPKIGAMTALNRHTDTTVRGLDGTVQTTLNYFTEET